MERNKSKGRLALKEKILEQLENDMNWTTKHYKLIEQVKNRNNEQEIEK